ncbi:stAR-related lipid transfer protein [Paratrimastix pyriformis]|uniref:StAR-related lipid transfer protein n=1 Tax=Paratrimastix pyriformis TaxID=342808 RepID=A0ABQ8U8C8_9EUKA|nr:stAR-related lipid transfer protein [Paratrimastix pyriformis]
MAFAFDLEKARRDAQYIYDVSNTPLTGEWRVLSDDPKNCVVYRREMHDDVGIPEFCGVGLFSGVTPWEMNLILRDYDFRRRCEASLLQMGCIAHPETDFWALYNRSAAVLGGMVSSRDFLDFSCARCDPDGGYTHGGSSIEMPSVPPVTGCIRGRNYTCGTRVQPGDAPNTVKVTYIIRSDLKGSMPQWVVNKAMVGVVSGFFAQLRKNLPSLDKSRYPAKPDQPGLATPPGWVIPPLNGTPGVLPN